MPDRKKPEMRYLFLSSKPEAKEQIETCVHCGTKYDKKEEHKPEIGTCPKCGGTATEEMGDPKSTIGRVFDEYVNPHFKLKEKTG